MRRGFIYKITNNVTGKVYIGQTRNFEQRIKDHFKRTHSECKRLYNSIQKHSKENFSSEIIKECEFISDIELNKLEIDYIRQFNSTLDEFGYNIRLGGCTQSGWNHSDYTKNKISQSKKGQGLGIKLPQNSERFLGGGNPRAKKVICIDTGEIFDCAKDAAIRYNGDNSVIIKCCKGKLKTHRGLKWEYYLN